MGEANSWIALVPVDGSFQKILVIMHWFGSDKHSFNALQKLRTVYQIFLKLLFYLLPGKKYFD